MTRWDSWYSRKSLLACHGLKKHQPTRSTFLPVQKIGRREKVLAYVASADAQTKLNAALQQLPTNSKSTSCR